MRSNNKKAETHDDSATRQDAMPTPLELATLSAQLVMAELLPRTGQKETAQAALKFIDVCKAVANAEARKRAIFAKAREVDPSIEKMWNAHKGKPIPLSALIRSAKASRVKLTREELAHVNESREWNLLSDEERNRLRFLHFAPAENKSSGESEAREKAMSEGFHPSAAVSYVQLIRQNLKGRAAHQRQAAAHVPKKKRKPQFQNAKGQFSARKRRTGHDNAGQYASEG